jgi:hypothetical protein
LIYFPLLLEHSHPTSAAHWVCRPFRKLIEKTPWSPILELQFDAAPRLYAFPSMQESFLRTACVTCEYRHGTILVNSCLVRNFLLKLINIILDDTLGSQLVSITW